MHSALHAPQAGPLLVNSPPLAGPALGCLVPAPTWNPGDGAVGTHTPPPGLRRLPVTWPGQRRVCRGCSAPQNVGTDMGDGLERDASRVSNRPLSTAAASPEGPNGTSCCRENSLQLDLLFAAKCIPYQAPRLSRDYPSGRPGGKGPRDFPEEGDALTRTLQPSFPAAWRLEPVDGRSLEIPPSKSPKKV